MEILRYLKINRPNNAKSVITEKETAAAFTASKRRSLGLL